MRAVLVRFKGTSWSTVVLLLGLVGAVVALSLADKDTATLIAFLTVLVSQYVNMLRTDQAASNSEEIKHEVEEVKQNVDGSLSRLIGAKTTTPGPVEPTDAYPTRAVGRDENGAQRVMCMGESAVADLVCTFDKGHRTGHSWEV